MAGDPQPTAPASPKPPGVGYAKQLAAKAGDGKTRLQLSQMQSYDLRRAAARQRAPQAKQTLRDRALSGLANSTPLGRLATKLGKVRP